MLAITWLDIWNLLCFSSCYINERKPLIHSSTKRSVKTTGYTLPGKRRLKYYKPLTKKQKPMVTQTAFSMRRQFIINELVETEQRYVERLHMLDIGFMLPLVKLESDCWPLAKFYTQVKLCVRFHSALLKDFMRGKSIPSVFNKTGFFLPLTQDYMNLYPKVSSIIQTLSYRSKKFRELIKNNELVHQVRLNDLLVEPVQRIQWYKLRLNDLLAYTPRGHPEFKDLEKALKKIVKINLKLIEAQNSDSPRARWGINLGTKGREESSWAPRRKFVRKNVFWCVFQSESFHFFPPLRVRAFLFFNCIIICEDKKVGRSYKFLDEIRLCDIFSLEFVFNPHMSFKKHKISTNELGFELSAAGHRTLELYHSNHSVIKKWFEMILELRRENKMTTDKSEQYSSSRASPKRDPGSRPRMKNTSTINVTLSVSDVTSSYGSLPKNEPTRHFSTAASLDRSETSSFSSSVGCVGTIIDLGVVHKSSPNQSDYEGVYQATSLHEKIWKIPRNRSGNHIKVTNNQPRRLSTNLKRTRRRTQDLEEYNQLKVSHIDRCVNSRSTANPFFGSSRRQPIEKNKMGYLEDNQFELPHRGESIY